jgi:RNA-directed DNA polymerase
VLQALRQSLPPAPNDRLHGSVIAVSSQRDRIVVPMLEITQSPLADARLTTPGIWFLGDHPKARLMAHWNQRSFHLLQRTRVHLSPLVDTATPAACRHLKGRGGVKGAVRSVYRALPRARFVARFDIRSYYESLRHDVVLRQIAAAGADAACQSVVGDYIRLPDRLGSGRGIVAGSFLSPLLGALYLVPLDRAMEQRVSQGRLVSYVRYMDDFVLLARTRWQLRRAIAEVHAVTGPIGLRMHPDKRFIGSLSRGFDFLGYQFHPGRKLRPSGVSHCRLRERARRLYEQGGDRQRLRLYVLRWWRWVHGGLGEGRSALVSRQGGYERTWSQVRIHLDLHRPP